MSGWLLLGLGVVGFLFAAALVARAVWRTVTGFVEELRLARLTEVPVEIRPVATLRDVESLLLSAEDGLRTVLRQTWRELVGLGNPALRQRNLVAAWGDLLNAQRAMRTLGLEPGDDVPLVDDPLHALAVRKAWAAWGLLMLFPWVFRASYTVVVVRRNVTPLLARVRELERQVRDNRADTPAPAPPRSARERIDSLRPVAA